MSQSPILTGAKILVSELPHLLSPELAQEYHEKITTLITQIENQEAQTAQLNALLRQSPPLQQWMNAYIKGKQIRIFGDSPFDSTFPDQNRRYGGDTPFTHLSGDPREIDCTPSYKCVECGAELESPQIGIKPQCPDHPDAQIQEI